MDESLGLTPEQIATAYVAAVEGKQKGETLEPSRYLWAPGSLAGQPR